MKLIYRYLTRIIMNKINDEIIRLVNKKIIQVSIGEYQVQLNMELNYSILVESSIEFIFKDNTVVYNVNTSDRNDFLFMCHGRTIKEAIFLNDNSLMLKLDNGITLKINCVGNGNESYQINLQDDYLVF